TVGDRSGRSGRSARRAWRERAAAEQWCEGSVKDAKGTENGNGPVVLVDAGCRRIVLNRFVVVGQVGLAATPETGRAVGEARENVFRRRRDRTTERFLVARRL